MYTRASTAVRYTQLINSSRQKFMLLLIPFWARVITAYKFRFILYITSHPLCQKVNSLAFYHTRIVGYKNNTACITAYRRYYRITVAILFTLHTLKAQSWASQPKRSEYTHSKRYSGGISIITVRYDGLGCQKLRPRLALQALG